MIGVKPTPKSKESLASNFLSILFLILIGFVVYYFLIKPRLYPAYEEMGFSCEGKTHCSHMASCDEAKYYLKYCPNVKIDGNNDGEPCERQLCNSSW